MLKDWLKKKFTNQTTPSKDKENQEVSEKKEEKNKEEANILARLKERLGKTRQNFVKQIDQLIKGRTSIDQELLEELEEILVTADMGITTVEEIFEQLRTEVSKAELKEPEQLKTRLKKLLLDKLDINIPPLQFTPNPFVILVVGVNGVGKTTTIAKLAYYLKQQGKSVLMVASDTFRAAAIEQLETWGKKIDVPVIKHGPGADPSAVCFDGLEAAKNRKIDVVIVDTAGRLHTKVNLMEELKKIKRVASRKIEGAPHEVFLVLDATTGQNAISQAKLFHEAVDVTGLILTKLDGTAKGGIVVSITNQLKIPIRFIGIGEKMEDLKPFNPQEFIEAIFEK